MAVTFWTNQIWYEQESYGIHASFSPIHTSKREEEMDYTDVALTAHLATPSFSVILKMDY